MSRDSDALPAKRGPRPRFTRQEVLSAALRVIDTVPPSAFTMRRVADELGVAVMTLYGYVRSKEEILEGVVALLLDEAHQAGVPASTWDDRLWAAVCDLHGVGRRHPNLVTLVLSHNSAAPGLFHIRERMLTALFDAGFSDTAAVHILGVLCNYALGFAGAQAAAAPIDRPERITELSGDEFPSLSRVAAIYSNHLADEAFAHGLELLIAGLKAEVAGNRTP